MGPTTSLLALYHADVPLPLPSRDAYGPSALTLLRYLATTILTTHSLHHVLARKAARERSRAEPTFGLEEGVEGILQGFGANDARGLVFEMEHRRKSGRGVREWYFLPLQDASVTAVPQPGRAREKVILLEDHPEYGRVDASVAGAREGTAEVDATFDLGLTEKQRRDREGVVLPYFDAQNGGGEGGRILYDMGEEDDFDEEEDEI
jgi:elongator complex protein 5